MERGSIQVKQRITEAGSANQQLEISFGFFRRDEFPERLDSDVQGQPRIHSGKAVDLRSRFKQIHEHAVVRSQIRVFDELDMPSADGVFIPARAEAFRDGLL